MDVTVTTWVIALLGLGLISLLWVLQLVAVFRPRTAWTIENVYGGSPENTDPAAYVAFNQATAWADSFLWAPLQVADRDLGFRRNTVSYWVVVWGMWPAFGVVEGVHCFARLLE